MTDDRPEPFDLDAEEAVLGSCLIDPDAVPVALSMLKGADFYRDKNGVVFGAIDRIFARNEAVNRVTVASELGERLEILGGSAYLGNLIQNTPTSVNADHYAGIVRRLSIMRNVIAAGRRIEAIGYDAPADVDEALGKAQAILLGISRQAECGDGFRDLSDIVEDVWSNAMDLFKSRVVMPGICTGFDRIDKATGGLAPGTLTLLMGRPGMGKSQMMLELTSRIASTGIHVAIYSLEMRRAALGDRMVFSKAGIDRSGLRTSVLENRLSMERQDEIRSALTAACGELSEWPVHIDDKSRLTTSQIYARAKVLMHRVPLGIIFVDHISLIGNQARDDVKRMDVISQDLHDMAKDFDVPVVALCQMSREAEHRDDKRPKLTDLRSSGALEQNADNVAGLYREGYYKKTDAHIPQELEVLGLKWREAEANWVVRLQYTPATGRIS